MTDGIVSSVVPVSEEKIAGVVEKRCKEELIAKEISVYWDSLNEKEVEELVANLKHL